jgi:hypothetical protein
MIRPEIQQLVNWGAFPSSKEIVLENVKEQENLLHAIKPPISDEEARQLANLFGPDDYFGMAWSLVHLIESASSWPIKECLTDSSNEWVKRLVERAQRR